MAGCFGSHPEDRAIERELDRYLDKTYGVDFLRDAKIEELTMDKFHSLHLQDWHGTSRWTRMEAAVDQLKDYEFVAIAKALYQKNYALAGRHLEESLLRVCSEEAEYEVDDEVIEPEGREYEREES